MGTLSAAQVEQYHRHGYVVLRGALSSDMVRQARERAVQLLDDMPDDHISVFSTKTGKQDRDKYFLESGDKIRFFFEERAFNEDGSLKKPRKQCINKIGHALHDLDDVFEQVSYSPYVAGICKSLGYQRPIAVQSMYITKQAEFGGEVRPHQDGTFLYTNPQSVVGIWWALENCHEQNGCLWAVPGSHQQGVKRWFRRKDGDKGTEFEPKEDDETTTLRTEGAVPLHMEAGDAVLLHHALVHFSEENQSPETRHAYSIHVVEGTSDVEYPSQNWLQRGKELPFRCIYDHVKDTTLSA